MSCIIGARHTRPRTTRGTMLGIYVTIYTKYFFRIPLCMYVQVCVRESVHHSHLVQSTYTVYVHTYISIYDAAVAAAAAAFCRFARCRRSAGAVPFSSRKGFTGGYRIPCGRSCSRKLVDLLKSPGDFAGLANALSAAPREPGARRSTAYTHTHTHTHTYIYIYMHG